jgi:hypothetical protein
MATSGAGVLQGDHAGCHHERLRGGHDVGAEVVHHDEFIGCIRPAAVFVNDAAARGESGRGQADAGEGEGDAVRCVVLRHRAGTGRALGGVSGASDLVRDARPLQVCILIRRVARRDQHHAERVRVHVDGATGQVFPEAVVGEAGHKVGAMGSVYELGNGVAGGVKLVV